MQSKQYGNVEIDVQKENIDMLSLSGHKIGAQKGIGALYIKNGIQLKKFLNGGYQEKNMRAGTENVPAIVGLGKACELAKIELNEHIEKTKIKRNKIIDEIMKNVKDVRLNGSIENRLPGNVNISFKEIDGNELLFKLDELGICVSTGSACSSGSSEPSHVLVAIEVEKEYINNSVRITIGKDNTDNDVNFLIKNLINVVNKLREQA